MFAAAASPRSVHAPGVPRPPVAGGRGAGERAERVASARARCWNARACVLAGGGAHGGKRAAPYCRGVLARAGPARPYSWRSAVVTVPLCAASPRGRETCSGRRRGAVLRE